MNVPTVTGNPALKRGFYQVGPDTYISKIKAIMASQETGHFPYWNFNDQAFGAKDWTVEPQESLWELYRQRAQQLRNSYDYIVLLYSGGADSTNVLQSFLFNNIPIDEVMSYGPFSTTQGRVGTLTEDPENNYREIDLVALPYLNQLSKNYNFKVTLYDWTEDMVKGFDNADWIWTDVSHRFSSSMSVRNKIHEASVSAQKAAESGKTVGFILGMDKPRVMYKDNTFQCAFLDLFMTMSVGPKDLLLGKNWFIDELFYWTPDLPELVIKQAHLVMNFFKQNPNLIYLVDTAHLGGWQHREEYYEICKALCYPYWNRDAFQTDKISNPTFTEHDNWYNKTQSIESKKIWLDGLSEVNRLIDPKWLHNGTIHDGLVGSWSKFYTLSKS
jgi:hypothetical protein